MGSIPGSGRFPGEGNGNPLHYSCLENPMDRGAGGLQSMGSQRSQTQLRLGKSNNLQQDKSHCYSVEWKQPDTKAHVGVIHFIWNVQNRQIPGDRKQISGCQGWGERTGIGNDYEWGFPLGWENVLEPNSGDSYTTLWMNIMPQNYSPEYGLKEGLSGSPVAKTLHFHCRGCGFLPWWGN